jgi:hypothetical protein
MIRLTGIFETPHASKYLQQLCKHFAHKVEATFDATWGVVALPCGKTEITASETTLSVTIELVADDKVEHGKHVIDSHLQKFAFREEFEAMDWAAISA